MKRSPLATAGVIAGPLFVVAFLVQGWLRADYDWVRHPVSSLALGPGGGLQTALFLVCGALYLLFSFGVRGWGRVWLALWGASLIGAGIFTTDPVSGYPAGTPTYPDGTVSGALHDLFALLGIVGLIGAFVVLRKRGGPGWSAYSLGTLVVFVVCFALGAAGTGQISGLVDIAGLLERIAVIGACAWLTALALRTRPA